MATATEKSTATQGRTAPPPADPQARRRMLAVINRHSRSGGVAAGIAIARLNAAGVDLTVTSPQSPTEVGPWIEAHAEEGEAVVIAGGDGSLNAVAPALLKTGLPLGILPTGTANDLARTLGIPTDIEQASDLIAAGHKRQIDIGEVNGHHFFNVASIGLSAKLANSLSSETKRRFGRLGYALTAMRVLAEARPFHAEIASAEGTVRVKTLQIAIGNGRYYGGGMAVEENATIDDGHLDLYSLEVDRVWKLLLMAKAFRAGRHGLWEEVRATKGERFEIRTRHPHPINTDGELVTFTPARFNLLPKAITVFTPERVPESAA